MAHATPRYIIASHFEHEVQLSDIEIDIISEIPEYTITVNHVEYTMQWQ